MFIIRFFWKHIKPYKWHYLLMLLVSFVTSFYSSAYHYSIKLFLDRFANANIKEYRELLSPIILFMGTQLMLDFIWRMSDIAEWKSVPYVRRSILLESY